MLPKRIPAVRVYRYHPASQEVESLKITCADGAQFREDASLPYGTVKLEIHIVGTREVVSPQVYFDRCLGRD